MTVQDLVRRGDELSRQGSYAEAEDVLRAALAQDSGDPMAWNNLGWVRQSFGDQADAEACYREALARDERHVLARRNLCRLLVGARRARAARTLIWRELAGGAQGFEWCSRIVTDLLRDGEYDAAGELALVLTELRWSSRWFPAVGPDAPPGTEPESDTISGPDPIPGVPAGEGDADPGPAPRAGVTPVTGPPERRLTVAKLRHDAEQLAYLTECGGVGHDLARYVAAYRRIADRLERDGIEHQVPLTPADEDEIGEVYNRIVHLRATPRVARALSERWDAAAADRDYHRGPGVVVLDDVLTDEALRELRAFCLESTVWAANRYAHGRLGAFFHDGFGCPLLLQIAEELRAALPSVLPPEYPLRQVWGFKNDYTLPPGSTLHADFAAVNVNLWITPTEANLEPGTQGTGQREGEGGTGGLDIYDINAPLWWDFTAYNGRPDLMRTLLADRRATRISVPYRANRAIIFNSDLFHATQAVRFAPGYANRRINVTFLFGDRADDRHFPQIQVPSAAGHAPGSGSPVPGGTSAWRSYAFASRRTRSR